VTTPDAHVSGRASRERARAIAGLRSAPGLRLHRRLPLLERVQHIVLAAADLRPKQLAARAEPQLQTERVRLQRAVGDTVALPQVGFDTNGVDACCSLAFSRKAC
jgi:hypothetical protein